jgi:hypothetical protein
MGSVSKYPKSLQDDALRRIEEGATLSSVARLLEIPKGTLLGWRLKAYRPGPLLDHGHKAVLVVNAVDHRAMSANVRWSCCEQTESVAWAVLRRVQIGAVKACARCSGDLGARSVRKSRVTLAGKLPMHLRPKDDSTRHAARIERVLRAVFPGAA